MAEVFSNSHIACLPSYHEGTPRVLLEAASCGRAIVTTDVPGCRQIVKDNEGGLVVPVKNPIALAESLRTLVDNPGLRRKMGKRGREIILNEFSDDIIISQTLALYERLLLNTGLHSKPSVVDLNIKIESHSN
jgi:glycosyltransferase involved in cell wall biosynthesis